MNQRSLRYTDGKSDKFWEIQLTGVSHTVRYGRYGTAGQTQTKAFDSDDAALKSFEKLVAEKLKKGYVDDGTAIVPPEPVAIVPKKPTTEITPVVIPENWRSMALMEIQAELVQDKKQLCELAAIDAIPEEYWGLLNIEVRTAIAQQEFNSPQIYQRLATDEHEHVRVAIASNLYTPIKTLSTLSQDRSIQVRLATARNTGTPRESVNTLENDAYQEVRKVAQTNQKQYDFTIQLVNNHRNNHRYTGLPLTLISDLSVIEEDMLIDYSSNSSNWDSDVSEYTKQHITTDLPPERLYELFESHILTLNSNPESCKILTSIARNPNTPIQILEKLAENEHLRGSCNPQDGPCYINRNLILEAIAINPASPAPVLLRLAKRNNLFISIAIAFNQSAPNEALNNLDLDKKWDSRLCGGHQLYSKQYEKHYQDYLTLFYFALAHNPNTPLEILLEISNGKNKKFRIKSNIINILYSEQMIIRAVFSPRDVARHNYRKYHHIIAQNSTTSTDFFERILSDQDSGIRAVIGMSGIGLPLLMSNISNNSNSLSRFFALIHASQSSANVVAAFNSIIWLDRYAITQNSSTPKDLLETLAQDEHPYVQAAARSALGLEIITSSTIAATSEPVAPEKLPTPEVSPVALNIERSITLLPEDRRWTVWLEHKSVAKPEDYPHDRIQAISILVTKLRVNRNHDLSTIMLEDILPNILREAHHQQMSDFLPDIITALHVAFGFTDLFLTFVSISQWNETKCVELMRDGLKDNQYYANTIKLAFDPTYLSNQPYSRKELHRKLIQWTYMFSQWLSYAFEKDVLNSLDDVERELLRCELRAVLPNLATEEQWRSIFHVAASLGIAEGVESCVAQFAHKSLGKRYFMTGTNIHYSSYLMEQVPSLVLRLSEPSLMQAQMRRLDYTPNSATEIKSSLAALGVEALEFICQGIKRSGSSKVFGILIETINSPEMAPYLLELALQSKVSKEAQAWLADHPSNAIVGLLPIAAGINVNPIILGKNELIEAAGKFLRTQVQRGHRSLIQQALELAPEAVVSKVQLAVLEHPDLNLQVISADAIPEWLQNGMAELPRSKSAKTKAWILPEDLPPISMKNASLSQEHIQACLTALSLSTLDSPLPLIRNLKIHATPNFLDNFTWSLFERWLTEGAPNKEKWAMCALGLLGSDHIALKLIPLIRTWPGENQHARAVLGLECLRTIGTDTALMLIHGIAQKIKFQGLKGRAQECIEAIARDRHLTADQLADRIIPDCGLGENGQRTFDFGARQFQFLLGSDLKPMLRDPQGKKITTLPKPTIKDDAETAAQSIADWKLMKKQISDVAKLHSLRLEAAMIEHRTWPWAEFENLLARHPLMTHLVQRLIWATYDVHGKQQGTFRLAEDMTYSDANDEPYTPDPQLIVGIPHILTFDQTIKPLWGEVLSDYKILQPFPQISRDTYVLTEAEQAAEEIQRFAHIQIPGATLARTMESQGWLKGGLHDHGDYRVHYKYFSRGDVTAIVGDYESQHVQQSSIWGDDAIKGCLFIQGECAQPYDYPKPGSWYAQQSKLTCLTLDKVDSIVISEVIRDMTMISSAK
jgi:predicted DNA-binding WGR domain protein